MNSKASLTSQLKNSGTSKRISSHTTRLAAVPKSKMTSLKSISERRRVVFFFFFLFYSNRVVLLTLIFVN